MSIPPRHYNPSPMFGLRELPYEKWNYGLFDYIRLQDATPQERLKWPPGTTYEGEVTVYDTVPFP